MKCFVFNPFYWLLSAVGAAALLALLSIPMQDGEVLWLCSSYLKYLALD